MRLTGIRAVFGITALICLAVLFRRAWHGPYSVHSPMNAEGIFAPALLGLALASPGAAEAIASKRRGPWPELLTLPVVAALAPFPGYFLQPEADRFFRALVYLFYGFEARLAGLLLILRGRMPYRSLLPWVAVAGGAVRAGDLSVSGQAIAPSLALGALLWMAWRGPIEVC